MGLECTIYLACGNFCPNEFGNGEIEFTSFMTFSPPLVLPAITTKDASLPQYQNTEEMEPTVEFLPVEFQASLSLISSSEILAWSSQCVIFFFHLALEVHGNPN